MIHGLSIDVEDYFQIIYRDYFQIVVPPSTEVERNTNWLLDTLAEASVKATFFVLGNVAHQYPPLVKRIVQEGHETGVHGYDHKYLYTMKPEGFREEIGRAKDEIENRSGSQVFGHRSPTFSMTKKTLWAIEILLELGFLYDSSIYPITGPRYGIPNAKKTIFRWPNGLYEIPLSCLEIIGRTIPVAGGGYIRHFPYWWTKFCLHRLQKLKRPGIVYLHPYEFEYTYPELDYKNKNISFAAKNKLKFHSLLQGRNRGIKQRSKLNLLLSNFTFVPLKQLIENI